MLKNVHLYRTLLPQLVGRGSIEASTQGEVHRLGLQGGVGDFRVNRGYELGILLMVMIKVLYNITIK